MAAVPAVDGSPQVPPAFPAVGSPPWHRLIGPGTTHREIPRSPAGRRELRNLIGDLPGGTSLVLSSRGFGSRGHLRRFAREAGLALTAEYVGIPSDRSPTCYVEDSREALRFFFSRVLAMPRGGSLASLALEVVRSAARLRWTRAMFAAVAPARIALARIHDGPGRTADLLHVDGMRTVVLALSKDPNAKVTVLYIPRGSAEPVFVVKVATTEIAEASVIAEHRALTQLRSALPATVAATLPEAVELRRAPEHTALVTTALGGTPMSVRYHSWRHLANPAAVKADFDMAAAWLARFQAAGTRAAEPIDLDGGADGVLERRFGLDPGFERTMAAVSEVRRRLRVEKTVRTAVHGDFWFGNLLTASGEVSGVVDWEAGTLRGEPLRDVVRFALAYALYLDRHTAMGHNVSGHGRLKAGSWGAGIEYAIDADGWFPNLFRSFVREGLARLGADPDCWRAATLAGLVDVAATADHDDFARAHWTLFQRIYQ